MLRDEAVAEDYRRKLIAEGASDVRMIRVNRVERGDRVWAVRLYEHRQTLQERVIGSDAKGRRTVSRYTCLEQRFDGRVIVHGSSSTSDSRRKAEDAYDGVVRRMSDLGRRGNQGR